ncbi:MAG: methionine biosynthesis protein MetW [Candidatus Omnitrophica bacterium]|nr:methionine biosynthesis protein MetW [Candidatus Omnitrophota bacterium]MBU1869483.1 methionine biosynthesis protein MetW [Candidatus Omnitrophota bacterium]
MKPEINRLIYSELASPHLKSGSRVLEIGCCDAKNFYYLRELKPVSYFGVDLDDANLKLASANNVRVIKADLEKGYFPFKSRFDLIIITEVLEHLKSPGNLLDKIRPFLNAGGLVLVSLPNEYNLFSRLRALFGMGIDDNALKSMDKHLHFPTVTQSIGFMKEHFWVIGIKYWSSSGGRLSFFLRFIPDSFFTFLAGLMPGLFSRGVIILCKAEDKQSK